MNKMSVYKRTGVLWLTVLLFSEVCAYQLLKVEGIEHIIAAYK